MDNESRSFCLRWDQDLDLGQNAGLGIRSFTLLLFTLFERVA